MALGSFGRWILLVSTCAGLWLVGIAGMKIYERKSRSRRQDAELDRPMDRSALTVSSGIEYERDLESGEAFIRTNGELIKFSQDGLNEYLSLSSAPFDVEKHDVSDVCTICLEEMSAKDGKCFISQNCVHAFHVGCVGRWLFTRGEVLCPICKVPMISDDNNENPLHWFSRRGSAVTS
uniref:RING-type domain-containing protein n=1 Tax=Rhodosorus marinus TaxID=101924 RepID=A0A7S0BD51_9RHOD|mmetsp:Transcript_10307/g.14905  ORF Transcript_10307/g.14905 Transcript_10307/m.14905 type:complete len:178 (+) Transcript_10307:369-902(+)